MYENKNFSIASKGVNSTFFTYLHALFILMFENNISTVIKDIDSYKVDIIAQIRTLTTQSLSFPAL